ncbi:MAG: type II secretion system F family protein [Betaproteobacteria bacterium]|nr:type II secretion system F family protein [Betaproteobacteria bacterium]
MKFRAKVYRRDAGVAIIDLDAADIGHAQRELRIQGYRPLQIDASDNIAARLWPGVSRRRAFPLLIFSQELAALTEAGLSLIEAIDALHGRSAEPTNQTIARLRTSLREGRSLSGAMADMPEQFPELFVATIRSSEETGDLARALRRYIDYRLQLDELRDKLIAAAVYPALLLAVGGVVVIFLLGYVVPRFALVFEGLGDNLPYLSRLLIGWGQFAANHMPGLAAGFALLLAAGGYTLMRSETRSWLNEFAWKLPLVGERLRIYQLARFTRTLAMLLSGGIPLVTALGMVRELLRQPLLQSALEEATRAIREGQSITDAFARHGLATDVGLKMLAVGERSGNLAPMLDKLASFYDLENQRFVAWSSRLIEPLFMAGIGLVVGVIVLLMYFPIFELAGNLQ